ncbi:hypothetical protein L4D76_10730 [Photobacterium sagamiensis]|uniref:hypothetical protein n=1 Tax=Photobacterium sagamiensis TaxID=2910241 RepID=UPI003D0BE81C
MKLRYFAYTVRQQDTQQKILYNLKLGFDAFCEYDNKSLKGDFKKGDEKLYLIKVTTHQNLFYFVRTSDDSFLKRIDLQNITIGELQDKLNVHEKVVHTSYVYICPEREIIGFANGTGCPRPDSLQDYINLLFEKVGLDNFKVKLEALSESATKEELMKMDVVSSMFIDTSADRTLGRLVSGWLTGSDDEDFKGKITITIKPESNNMKDTFTKILNRHSLEQNDSEILQIGAKAKHNELHGQLVDYWLDQSSKLADPLNPRAKRMNLHEQIEDKVDNNTRLKSVFKSHIDNIPNLNVMKSHPQLDAYKHVATYKQLLSAIQDEDKQDERGAKEIVAAALGQLKKKQARSLLDRADNDDNVAGLDTKQQADQ